MSLNFYSDTLLYIRASLQEEPCNFQHHIPQQKHENVKQNCKKGMCGMNAKVGIVASMNHVLSSVI